MQYTLLHEPNKSRFAQVSWIAALILTAICLGSAFLFDHRWDQDISRWPIELPMRWYTFTDHPHFRDFDDPIATDNWDHSVLHEWWHSQWRDDQGNQFYRGIDMFHKMHCLVAIRTEFAALATGEARLGHEPVVEAGNGEIKLAQNQDHLEHCFDFLRQDILCAADMTLEPMTEDYQATKGEGIEHECRDWRSLLKHMGLPNMEEI